MDEAVVADIDAGMIDPSLVAGAEEHDVAGLQRIARDLRRVVANHLARGARQVDTGLVAKQIADEPTAIETALDRGAAVPVTGADQLEAAFQQALHLAFLAALLQGRLPRGLKLGLQVRQTDMGFTQTRSLLRRGVPLGRRGGTADEQRGEGQGHEGSKAVGHGSIVSRREQCAGLCLARDRFSKPIDQRYLTEACSQKWRNCTTQ